MRNTIKIDLPKEILAIIAKVEKAGFEIYIVGGAVRDVLMGKLCYDWDFTTNATPEEITKLFANSFYDNKFGTVGIPSKSEGVRPYEITTFRTEHGYSDSRRPDKVEWGKSLDEDLKRRDFTINAMALQRVKGNNSKKVTGETKKPHTLSSYTFELIDHYEGQKDLEKRRIRAVGDPHERFSEDALRMMRAVRIASELNFKIEEETKEAIKANRQRLQSISPERIKVELFKLLSSPHSYNGVEQMREVRLVDEILPELEKAFGIEQKSPGRHHIYDVGTHLMMSLKYCKSPDPVVRLATLIHDIGKPQTFNKLANGTITFYNHEVVGAKIAKNIADRLRFSNDEKNRLWKLVRFHQFTVDENQSDKALRRFIKNVGIENVSDILELRTADRLGSGSAETSWRTEEFKARLLEVQKQPFSVHDLKIDGNDVMKLLNLKPGPKIGKLLGELFNEVEDGKLTNDKDALVNRLKNLDQDHPA